MARDPLGDRLKSYESVSDARLDPSLPILARIDGRAFHSFARGMDYTQSDEISRAWHVEPESEVRFGGWPSKMTFQRAAHATLGLHWSAAPRTRTQSCGAGWRRSRTASRCWQIRT